MKDDHCRVVGRYAAKCCAVLNVARSAIAQESARSLIGQITKTYAEHCLIAGRNAELVPMARSEEGASFYVKNK